MKNVKTWRTLGGYICFYSPSELDDIQRQHVYDEACLKAVIEDFLSGKGRYKQPLWRVVIWYLYEANESQLAEHIRSFAELVKGMRRYMIDCGWQYVASFTGCLHVQILIDVFIFLQIPL